MSFCFARFLLGHFPSLLVIQGHNNGCKFLRIQWVRVLHQLTLLRVFEDALDFIQSTAIAAAAAAAFDAEHGYSYRRSPTREHAIVTELVGETIDTI